MCAVCRNKSSKQDLIRVVRTNDGQVYIDNTYKLNGRGMYICKNDQCLAKAIKTRALNRAFKAEIDNKIYEELSQYNECK